MKSALEKAVSTLGRLGLPRTTRRSDTGTRNAADTGQELHCVRIISDASNIETTTDSEIPMTSMSMEADDFLFRKNNVLLKCPIVNSNTHTSPSGCDRNTSESAERSVSTHKNDGEIYTSSSFDDSFDSHILIPGFLFITTRGSNFGATLILNWVPNTSISAPSSSPPNASQSDFEESLVLSTPCTVQENEKSRYYSTVSIDLCSMEMIRIFYRMDESGFIVSGELVIKNKEQEFKVFYFKNGGLNDLVHIFRSWKYFTHTCHRDAHCHTFTVFSPKLSLSELHPLEGKLRTSLTHEMWTSLTDSEGRVTNIDYIRKVIFFQGMAASLRKEIWPCLLNVYCFDISSYEKVKLRKKYQDEYWKLNAERLSEISTASKKELCSQHSQIEKDVIRTDRSNPYYKGEDNQHLIVLMNIISNYLHYFPGISYTQGMTDLLAPLLAVLDDEVEAFWCFTKLMQSNAVLKPGKNQVSVKHQLEQLRLLLELLLPSFHQYLGEVQGGLTLMFCHRWLLVFLKREFDESDILFIWEACWTLYETKSFHLFICIAIMAIYGQKAIEKQMSIDELMVYFNTLSLQIPRDIVLSQARGYLHQFCQAEQINCALCEIMEKEFWLKEDSPRLFCNVCKGFGSCARTGYMSEKEVVC